jgi:hypothetical protein
MVVAVVVQQHRKALAHSDEVEDILGATKVAVDMVVLFTNKLKLLLKSHQTTRLVAG